MVTVFDSIVKIYNDKNELKGMGFVVKQEDDISYILTCNHVVYHSQNSEKRKIKVDDIDVEESAIIYGHELPNNTVDLAIIKVRNLTGKVAISLQKDIDEKSILELKTLSKVGNDTLSVDPKSIELQYQKNEPLQYCHKNSIAYLLKMDNEIVGGYSGSPIIDVSTGKVIGILNIVRDKEEKSCRALSISNITKIFPELESGLNILKKKNNKIVVFFNPINNSNNYDVIINNETFKDSDISIESKKKELIDHIFHLAKVPDRIIEFFVPPQLFTKNIHLWKNSRNKRLIEKHSVYFRSLNLAKITGELKEYWESKWDKDYKKYKNKLFNESITPIDSAECFHPSIVSAVCSSNVEFDKDDFFDLEEEYISIAVWKSACVEASKYDDFIEEMKKQKFNGFSQSFKEEIFKRKRCCSSHTSLMWDNPRDLPKKDLKNA